MGDIIKFDQWKMDHLEHVERTRKTRERSKEPTEQASGYVLREFPNMREEIDVIAHKVLNHEGVLSNPIWERKDVNPERWRTQFATKTITELADILKGTNDEDWVGNPIYYRMAAEAYFYKIRRERKNNAPDAPKSAS